MNNDDFLNKFKQSINSISSLSNSYNNMLKNFSSIGDKTYANMLNSNSSIAAKALANMINSNSSIAAKTYANMLNGNSSIAAKALANMLNGNSSIAGKAYDKIDKITQHYLDNKEQINNNDITNIFNILTESFPDCTIILNNICKKLRLLNKSKLITKSEIIRLILKLTLYITISIEILTINFNEDINLDFSTDNSLTINNIYIQNIIYNNLDLLPAKNLNQAKRLRKKLGLPLFIFSKNEYINVYQNSNFKGKVIGKIDNITEIAIIGYANKKRSVNIEWTDENGFVKRGWVRRRYICK